MRNRAALISSAFVVTVAGVLALAAPANAAETGDTPVTVEVAVGERAIAVPVAIDFDPISSTTGAQEIDLELGTVTVTDNIGGTADWTVSASAVTFASAEGGALGVASYASAASDVVGTATVTPSAVADLTVGSAVQTATGVSGANTATWNPTITLVIPAGALAGTYESAIVHSFL
jgi:hypothetical protein